MPKRWVPQAALRDRQQLTGYVAAADLQQNSILQEGMLVTPPELNADEREVAILVDASTGVAGKIEPGREVDVIASYPPDPQSNDPKAKPRRARSIVIVPGARVLAVGSPRLKGGNGAQEGQQDPQEVVPVTFALNKYQELKVSHAQTFAADVRLALLRPGASADRTLGGDHLPRRRSEATQGRHDPMSARLLIAVADDETARRAAAQAREAELEVVDIVSDPDELSRALRRLDIDVVLLHDALGGTPVLDLARDLSAAFPEVGLILLAAEDTPGLLRAAMQAGLRDVVALPLALESFEASVRAASQWSRTMRDRVTGEESAGTALGGQLVAVAGAKGGVGTTTVALHLGLTAVRLAPGRPVCLVDFDLQKGDFRALLDTPHRRSVVDLVDVSNEISVRHLQETLYTHKDGFRLLLAPEEGEKAEDVDSGVARNVLAAVKARHALTIVDIGAVATEATAIAAEMATQVIIVTTPDVLALRGVRRMRELWKRLGVREDEDVTIVLNQASRRREIQPDLARKVVGDTMAADDDPGRFQRARGGGQHRLAQPARGQQAARRVRGARQRARDPPAARGGRRARGVPRPARAPRRRARPDLGRVHGPVPDPDGDHPRAVADDADRRDVRQRQPRGAGGSARAGGRLEPERLQGGGAQGPAGRLAQGRRDREARRRSRCPCKLRVPVLLPGLQLPVKVGTTADTSVEDAPVPSRQSGGLGL